MFAGLEAEKLPSFLAVHPLGTTGRLAWLTGISLRDHFNVGLEK